MCRHRRRPGKSAPPLDDGGRGVEFGGVPASAFGGEAKLGWLAGSLPDRWSMATPALRSQWGLPLLLVAGPLVSGLAAALLTTVVGADDDVLAAVVVGLAAGLLVWFVLRAIAARPFSLRGMVELGLAVLCGVPLAYFVVFVAAYATELVILPLAVLSALSLAWLWSSLGREPARARRATRNRGVPLRGRRGPHRRHRDHVPGHGPAFC